MNKEAQEHRQNVFRDYIEWVVELRRSVEEIKDESQLDCARIMMLQRLKLSASYGLAGSRPLSFKLLASDQVTTTIIVDLSEEHEASRTPGICDAKGE